METPTAGSRRRLAWVAALCGFLAVAGFFLWTEHRAHLLGALPYLLLLACPLMHIFGHHGHHAHGAKGGESGHHHATEHGDVVPSEEAR
jgi:hypothetical protein